MLVFICYTLFVDVLCGVHRYTVLLCGKKAIYEALITKSVDFADRPQFYTSMLENKNNKGFILLLDHFIFEDHQSVSIQFSH